VQSSCPSSTHPSRTETMSECHLGRRGAWRLYLPRRNTLTRVCPGHIETHPSSSLASREDASRAQFVSTSHGRAMDGRSKTYMTLLSLPGSLHFEQSSRCGPCSCPAQVCPRERPALLRPPSIGYVTSFGFAPSADRRFIDVSQKARSHGRFDWDPKLQGGLQRTCRSGSMTRRAIAYRGNTSERLRSRCGVPASKVVGK
jgi:hypothetical protein